MRSGERLAGGVVDDAGRVDPVEDAGREAVAGAALGGHGPVFGRLDGLEAVGAHAAPPVGNGGRRILMGQEGSLGVPDADGPVVDRKSTRLNSSHPSISYAVLCLKK